MSARRLSVAPRQYRVLEQMDGRHPRHTDYPLLPGDIVVLDDQGSWAKVAPGLGIFGFNLSPEDISERCENGDDARWTFA